MKERWVVGSRNGKKYVGKSGYSYETRGLMMLVMLSSEKLGERGRRKTKEIVYQQPLPIPFPTRVKLIHRQRSLADWSNKIISCLLLCPL